MPVVDHVFVLMLENRSFDHFFGLSGRPGIPRPDAPGFGPGAADRSPIDPPHEFDDVARQVAGGAMNGFDPLAMKAFTPDQVPVASALADAFLLFDNWHSSLPGPTWPNRFFVHAASSGGLATSPSGFQSSGAVISTESPFRFEHGTLFDRLDAKGVPWRVYHGDVHPQVLALPGMVRRYLADGDAFRPLMPDSGHGISDFATDVNTPGYRPAYTFIEPDYAIQVFRQFHDGNSQHPRGRVSDGEALVGHVYASLRGSPLWPRSALLVLWDEHGGFFDHVAPPPAAPPGDAPLNRPHGGDPGFAFDRLGVRVPAMLASPNVPRGALGSQLFPGRTFDHASVVRTVRELFDLGPPLTARDAAAPSWGAALAPGGRAPADAGPLTLTPALAVAAAAVAAVGARIAEAPAGVPADVPPPPADAAGGPVDGFLSGVGLIALEVDRQVAASTGRPTLASVEPQSHEDFRKAREASLAQPDFRSQLVQYVNEVGVRGQAQRLRNGVADAAARGASPDGPVSSPPSPSPSPLPSPSPAA